ncbi:hypothetical protein FOXG_17913 [Fusarium oxysporum f. sp. lycopersici 4287]|uniref:Uncharacterized protein n=1 Tax=Fusarium oxysporum f. sp. lycopersici (strain 4287 / CBS 123668 / FGSC 9935 / NRRL 34936) TaxID=426428 RepID=A0A0J9U7F5_FUSO4|nr:hypothetical protein FOXG_17913 [Fusarium oxysporum f. sp. lycopersici 4287]KNA94747.1 hypothetical protein FOXG_17913 [Fusarium oxysporum f. sp. lycopersici 4287]
MREKDLKMRKVGWGQGLGEERAMNPPGALSGDLSLGDEFRVCDGQELLKVWSLDERK